MKGSLKKILHLYINPTVMEPMELVNLEIKLIKTSMKRP